MKQEQSTAAYNIVNPSGEQLYQVQQLAAPVRTTFARRFGKLINSSIFIWLLSTLLVGGATQLYQYNKSQQELADKVKALDLEIESRLSQFLTVLHPLITFTNDTTYVLKNDTAVASFTVLWNDLKRPPSKSNNIYTTYPEYQEVSLVSLIMLQAKTINSLGHDINEAKENNIENWKDFETTDLKKELQHIKEAGKWLMSTPPDDYRKDNAIDIERLIENFYRNVILGRWKMAYPYVDCSYQSPFC